jgi:hypothetical protein
MEKPCLKNKTKKKKHKTKNKSKNESWKQEVLYVACLFSTVHIAFLSSMVITIVCHMPYYIILPLS